MLRLATNERDGEGEEVGFGLLFTLFLQEFRAEHQSTFCSCEWEMMIKIKQSVSILIYLCKQIDSGELAIIHVSPSSSSSSVLSDLSFAVSMKPYTKAFKGTANDRCFIYLPKPIDT